MTLPIIQHAWVVPDLEAGCRHWHATLGVGPFLVNRDIALSEPRHRGRPVRTRFSTAIAQHGDIQIELVEQHDDTPSAYRELVPEGRIGFHHVAVIAPDFDASLAALVGQGHSVASDGLFGPMRFAYVDSSAVLGHMIEIIEDGDAIRAFFGAVRKAAAHWDGNPATLIRTL